MTVLKSTGKWINKLWFIHKMECYIAEKKKKRKKKNKLPTTQMNLKAVLNEIQIYCKIYCNRNEKVVVSFWGGGE